MKPFTSIEISIFHPQRDRDGKMVPGVNAKSCDLYSEIKRWKEGYYAIIVEELRSIKAKPLAQTYKMQNLPAVTISCMFQPNTYRKGSNIKSKTNLLCIDIDKEAVDAQLMSERHKNPNYSIGDFRDYLFHEFSAVFSGISCSGNGVFFIVKYHDGQHLDVFNDIQMYFESKYKIKIDAACKDLTRLRFVTYDTGCKVRDFDEAQVYKLRPEYLRRKEQIDEMKRNNDNRIVVKHSADVPGAIMERALSMVRNSRIGERHNKIRSAARLLGGYVATQLLDENYCYTALIKESININYEDIEDAKRTIRYGLHQGMQNPLEVRVITPEDPQFEFFAEQTEERQREINKLYNEIREGIRKGIPITDIAWHTVAEVYLIDVERVIDIAERLYDRFSYEFDIINKPMITQVEAFFTNRYDMCRDVVTDNIMIRDHGDVDWTEARLEDLWRELHSNKLKYKFEDMCRLLRSSFVPDFNSWEDFFKSLPRPKSNDEDPIGKLASYVTLKDNSEHEYFATMLKKMLVRSIKCALDDAYANRYVFVLASEAQSNGKSTFIRWLSPFGPHRFYAENPLEDNKDARIRTSETFIYNLEELATIGRMEINRLKATISAIGSRERKPYGRVAENMVRRCSFYASTNRIDFLTDDSNTRWLIFEIANINFDYSKDVNVHEVWGQAYKLYIEGYSYELNRHEAGFRDTRNVNFTMIPTEQDLLQRYFEPAEPDQDGSVFLTVTSIHERLLNFTKDSRIAISRVWIGRCLIRLDYKRVKNGKLYGYWVKPKNHPVFTTLPNDNQEIEETTPF